MSTNNGVMKTSASLGVLGPDVMLLIAEEADLATLRNLMLCSVATKTTFVSYEHSICQKRIQNLPIVPQATIHGKIQAPLSGIGEDLRADTFRGVRELTIRAERAEMLLAPGSFIRRQFEQEPIYNGLQDEERTSLLYGLKRAITTADRIADAIADVRIEQEIKTQEKEDQRAALEAQGFEVPPPADVTDPRCRWYDPALAIKAALREEHLGHLKTIINHIPKRDLVFLWYLADVAGRAFVSDECDVHDEDPWTNMTAFKEAFLSIGSMALWTYFNQVDSPGAKSISPKHRSVHNPSDPLQMFTRGAINLHLKNITEWELGARAVTEDEFDVSGLVLPGLYLTIRNTFAKLHGIPDEQQDEDDLGFAGDNDSDDEDSDQESETDEFFDEFLGEGSDDDDEFGQWEDEDDEEDEEDEEAVPSRESRADRITREMYSVLQSELRVMSGIPDEDDEEAEAEAKTEEE